LFYSARSSVSRLGCSAAWWSNDLFSVQVCMSQTVLVPIQGIN